MGFPGGSLPMEMPSPALGLMRPKISWARGTCRRKGGRIIRNPGGGGVVWERSGWTAHKQRVFQWNAFINQVLRATCVISLNSYTSDEKESLPPFTEMKSKLVPFGFNVPSRVSEHKQWDQVWTSGLTLQPQQWMAHEPTLPFLCPLHPDTHICPHSNESGVSSLFYLLSSTGAVVVYFFILFCNWCIVALQCCVSFFCTMNWISHVHIHPLSLAPPSFLILIPNL